MLATLCCLQLLVRELAQDFHSVFWQDWKGKLKGVCDEFRQRVKKQAVWQWTEERRWGHSWGAGLWKNAELKGLEEQNQHLCKHSEELTTHTFAHTNTHLYTGIQRVLLLHRYLYLPYRDVILGRVLSWNSDSLLHCEAITWSNRAQLITWTGSATSHLYHLPSQIITYHRNLAIFTTHSCQGPLAKLILHTETETHTKCSTSFPLANPLTSHTLHTSH